MGRKIGLSLIALGAFLVTAGLLIGYWAAPKLVVAPLDQYSVVESEASNATYFDTTKLQERTGVQVWGKTTIRGDVPKGNDERAAWEQFTSLVADDGTRGGKRISESSELAVFDRVSGEAINCCGERVEQDANVRHKGLIFKWPFNAQKKTYQLWDGRARQAFPATFEGVDEVGGVEAYKYVSTVPGVAVDEREVPAKILGLDPKKGDVEVDLVKTATKTYWIEPVTGAPMKVENQERQVVRAKSGEGEQVIFDGTVAYTDAQVRESVATAKDSKAMVEAVRAFPVPIGLVLGVIVLIAGVVLVLMARRRSPAAEHEGEVPSGELPDARQPDNGVRPGG